MNQPDQSNLLQPENVSNVRQEASHDAQTETAKKGRREWLPEDDDDWYEPDCTRSDRGN
jgi:hypothetical protein